MMTSVTCGFQQTTLFHSSLRNNFQHSNGSWKYYWYNDRKGGQECLPYLELEHLFMGLLTFWMVSKHWGRKNAIWPYQEVFSLVSSWKHCLTHKIERFLSSLVFLFIDFFLHIDFLLILFIWIFPLYSQDLDRSPLKRKTYIRILGSLLDTTMWLTHAL